jgi:malate dehydrogenase (quinone)
MKSRKNPSIVLIGAGIMSATLAFLLRKLFPDSSIVIFEKLDTIASESSDALNNAGTGHSAFCELNYTPELNDGSINIKKAISIASSFELSREFWCYLIQNKYIANPASFISPIPHISFVWGKKNVDFLAKRYSTMIMHPLFDEMEYTEDWHEMVKWMPLVIMGRDKNEKIAATKMHYGTDVNFGSLTRSLIQSMHDKNEIEITLNCEVKELIKQDYGSWLIKTNCKGVDEEYEADFVFVGAGGGALQLLDKSGIQEIEGYGGFPISGQWLICKDEKLIDLHNAKVYGKAALGSPPMSVPHLDTRFIDGKKELLFGPFAGFSTKFLKHGSYWDLPLSIQLDNIIPMLSVGWHNFDLTKYLVEQISQSPEDRLNSLKAYLPQAKMEQWELAVAGQRVQIIKKDEELGGVLEFGTEIISAADGSIAGLLGASPGASTALSAMIEVINKCFSHEITTPEWKKTLNTIVPSLYCNFNDEQVVRVSRDYTSKILFG